MTTSQFDRKKVLHSSNNDGTFCSYICSSHLPLSVPESSALLQDTVAAAAAANWSELKTQSPIRILSWSSKWKHLHRWTRLVSQFTQSFSCSGESGRTKFFQRRSRSCWWCRRICWISSGRHFQPLGRCWRTRSPGVSGPGRATRTVWPHPQFSGASLMRPGSKSNFSFQLSSSQTPLKH